MNELKSRFPRGHKRKEFFFIVFFKCRNKKKVEMRDAATADFSHSSRRLRAASLQS